MPNFTYSQKKCFCSLNVSINNQLVSLSSTTKYLDLTLDSQLKFDHHILLLIKKLSRAIGVLSKLRYYLPQPALIDVYFTILYPHVKLTY